MMFYANKISHYLVYWIFVKNIV